LNVAFFDMPLEQLRKYKSPDAEPADFDSFWRQTLKETGSYSLDATFEPVDDSSYKLIDAYDVTFSGFGGQRIKGWFLQPAGNGQPLPCVVSFLGYSGGRDLPVDHLVYVTAGFCNLVMDTRGQGGQTSDDGAAGPQAAGFMTRGIESPARYYYRRVFADAARAVEAAASHPHVDARRIAVAGGSQGGGIAIASAALAGKKVKLCVPDVPFLCHYRRAIAIVETHPYFEITNYLKRHRGSGEMVMDTLAYFDGVNLAKRITARSFFSLGLMDNCCPPSTVFAAYNNIKARKDIRIYEYNNHEGGGSLHTLEKLRFLRENF
jgi:cephalosporin-C deacetylase